MNSLWRSFLAACAGLINITVACAADSGGIQIVPLATRSEASAVANGGPPEERSIVNPLSAIQLAKLSATRERPLFAPTRRPPRPTVMPVVSSAPPQPERPQFVLVGTVLSDTGGIGLFLEKTTNQVFRLKVGEMRHGWTLQSIKQQSASLEKSGDVIAIDLPRLSQKLSTPTVATGQPIRSVNVQTR